MGYRAWKGPAGSLTALVGYLGGTTRITVAASVPGSGTFATLAQGDTGNYTPSWSTNAQLYMAGAVADNYRCAVRFPNVTVPQGATVTSCVVTYYGYNNTINNVSDVVEWALEQADNPTQVADAAAAASRITNLGTAVASHLNAATIGSANNPYTTQDMAAILQTIVNRPGWVSGNAIQFWTDYVQQSTGGRQVHSHYTGVAGGYEPTVFVEWTT